jgi:hypothetical protein
MKEVLTMREGTEILTQKSTKLTTEKNCPSLENCQYLSVS